MTKKLTLTPNKYFLGGERGVGSWKQRESSKFKFNVNWAESERVYEEGMDSRIRSFKGNQENLEY